jgi:hypothetical protein
LIDAIFSQVQLDELLLPQCCVVFAHSFSLTIDDERRILDMLFNVKQVGAVYMVLNAVLALAVAGETSGLVVDVGAKKTILYPVYEMNVPENDVRTVASPRDAADAATVAQYAQQVIDLIFDVLQSSAAIGAGWDQVLLMNTAVVSRADIDDIVLQRLLEALQQKYEAVWASAASSPQSSPTMSRSKQQQERTSVGRATSPFQIKATRELVTQGTFVGGALITSLSSFQESLQTADSWKKLQQQQQQQSTPSVQQQNNQESSSQLNDSNSNGTTTAAPYTRHMNGSLVALDEVVRHMSRLGMKDARQYLEGKEEIKDNVMRLFQSTQTTVNAEPLPSTAPTNATDRPLWVPDMSRSSCMMCNTLFSLLKRRHQ